MKIAIFIYSMSGGGAERVVSYLLPYLKKQGHEVHLVLMNSFMHFDIPDDIPIHYIENSKAHENGLKKLFKIPILALKYAKLTKRLNITHSFSLLSRPNYINIVSSYFNRKITKTIISERSFPSLSYGFKNAMSKINKLLIRSLFPKADLIICNTVGNSKDLINNFSVPETKVSVIHNPIDLVKIDKTRPVENFYDPSFFNLVTIGRLDAVKNHQLLIRGVQNIANVRLYIFGDGRLRSEIEQLIIDLQCSDKVFLMGFDTNPYKYLKGADLFVFSSNYEGFPNVILEALACGLPVLSTNCQSGPDEILELSEVSETDLMFTAYGLLVPVNNQSLMTKGIHYFVDNPKFLLDCRKNAIERAKDFEKEFILQKFLDVLIQ